MSKTLLNFTNSLALAKYPQFQIRRGSWFGIGITLILQVDNLTKIYDLVRRKMLHVLAEPADEYYGDRVFFFIDPFGYEWKISQPI